ncbi:MAG: hydroxyacylglutathione hydrolase [Geitlerinemataceae cyanobacterium]
MEILRLPVLDDNYVFLLFDPATKTAAVVDPAVHAPVLEALADRDATLVTIFNTHHHGDHVGANAKLRAQFPDVEIYASEADRGRIPGQTVALNEGDRVSFAGYEAEVFFVPGHTRGHIAYYFAPQANPAGNLETGDLETGELFCGDTLFAGGCGRLFEGTPAQMLDSLSKFRSLPDSTRVWCAHEYTESNLRFALTVDGKNRALSDRAIAVRAMRSRGESTVPSTIGLEKETNPFMRWDDLAIQALLETSDPVRAFAKLRGRKDMF